MGDKQKNRSEERVKFTIIKLQLPVGKIKGHISHVNSAGGLSGLDGLISQWQTCSSITSPIHQSAHPSRLHVYIVHVAKSSRAICLATEFLSHAGNSIYIKTHQISHSPWLQCQGNITLACDSVAHYTLLKLADILGVCKKELLIPLDSSANSHMSLRGPDDTCST